MSDHRDITHSQNFLRSTQFVAELLDKTNLTSDDMVVEIGPGTGIITRELAKRSGQVLAIEVDANLAARLRISLASLANVMILEADFLRWQLPSTPYKVFSNIPFNMTADIITKLLEGGPPPIVAYLIMQNTAAERFIGSPLAKNTQMSILLQPWFEMGVLTQISRQRFVPSPKVDAVLAVFRRREEPLVRSELRQSFRDFVIYGYNQWQPTILDSYRKIFSSQQRAIISRELGIGMMKPSELNLDQWLALFATFNFRVPEARKDLIRGAEMRLREQHQKSTKLHRTR